MEFFNQAIDILKILVMALGAGLAVWGVINLLEGYGSDNPAAKSQGIKQLNPSLLETTDTIATFVYRSAMVNGNFASGSAITLYQSIFGFLFVTFCNWIVKKVDPEYVLF